MEFGLAQNDITLYLKRNILLGKKNVKIQTASVLHGVYDLMALSVARRSQWFSLRLT